MDGEDVMKVEVYKERREHWKGDGKKREREKRNRRKTLGEESAQDHLDANPVSSGIHV